MAIQAISGGHVACCDQQAVHIFQKVSAGISHFSDILAAEQKNHFQNLGVFLLNMLYQYTISVYYISIIQVFRRGFVEFEFHNELHFGKIGRWRYIEFFRGFTVASWVIAIGKSQKVLGSPFGPGQRECGHLSQSKQDQRPPLEGGENCRFPWL